MRSPQNTRAPTGPGKRRPAKYSAFVVLALMICAAVVFCFPGVALIPFLDSRISRTCEKEYPGTTVRMKGLRYEFWTNTIECDSITIGAPDSVPIISAGRISVKGLRRLPLLLGADLTPDVLAHVLVDAREIVVSIPRWHHEIRVLRLRMSARDSTLAVDSLEYRPPAGDEEFFASTDFRKTRYLLVVSSGLATGLDVPGLIQGTGYRARSLRLDDAFLSVLIDKEKSEDAKAPDPRMPGEILESFGVPLRIDSVSLDGGRLRYAERFDTSSSAATLTCEGIVMTAAGIGNQAGGGDTMTIRGRAILMGSAEIVVGMSIPIATPQLSFRYSGRLGPMELREFNPYVERSDQLRVKTGVLHRMAFDVDVTAGMASGEVRLEYTDLKVVAINDRTGSESGVVNTAVSFIANNIKLRTTNIPDRSGAMKAGTVEYRRKRGDAFLEYAWLSVRSGISDLVGF